MGGIIAGAQLDAGDVAQAGDFAAVTGFEDDVAEFFGSFQPTWCGQGVLEVDPGGGGRLAQTAGGDLDVLFAHGADDIAGVQAEGSDFFGVEPEAHGIIQTAEHGGFGHAWQAGDFILNLQGNVIGEVGDVA